MSINQYPALELRLRLKELKANSEAIYERKYDPGKKLFSEFVDETFLSWSKANKRSCREDEQRPVTLKNFFGEKERTNRAIVGLKSK
jgi:hypothetical protein